MCQVICYIDVSNSLTRSSLLYLMAVFARPLVIVRPMYLHTCANDNVANGQPPPTQSSWQQLFMFGVRNYPETPCNLGKNNVQSR